MFSTNTIWCFPYINTFPSPKRLNTTFLKKNTHATKKIIHLENKKKPTTKKTIAFRLIQFRRNWVNMIVFATPGENMVYGLLKLAHPLFFECFFCASFCFCGFSCFSVLITASNQTYSMSYYSHRVNLHKSCCGCWLPRRVPVLTPHTLFGQPHSVAFVFSVCFSSLFVGV